MKHYINGIIVVEGKEDESYLSSFVESYYVQTHGYDVSKEEIEFLKEANKHVNIYVLVDPDKAGREIEIKLREYLPNATYLNIDISRCTRAKKNGVAECEIDEIINTLSPYFGKKDTKNNQVTYQDIYPLNKGIREYLSQKHHLGVCNNKQLINRINILGITKEEIKNSIKEYINDHR